MKVLVEGLSSFLGPPPHIVVGSLYSSFFPEDALVFSFHYLGPLFLPQPMVVAVLVVRLLGDVPRYSCSVLIDPRSSCRTSRGLGGGPSLWVAGTLS